MTWDLFADEPAAEPREEALAPGAVLLRGWARDQGPALLDVVSDVLRQAPLRHMTTPGGFEMSVAMTNCGSAGWITDRSGYRYGPLDPLSGRPWPPLPAAARAACDGCGRAGGVCRICGRRLSHQSVRAGKPDVAPPG